MKYQKGFTLNELLLSIFILLAIIGHGFNVYWMQQAYQAQEWVEVAIRVVGLFALPIGWIIGYIPF